MAFKGSLSFIIPIFMLLGQSLNYEIKRYHDPANYTHTPIVFIHGITSNCVELQHLVGMVSDLMNNTAYTKCIEVGNGKISSWFMDMRTQVQSACQGIMADPVFSSGVPVNIIGYSQGGLILQSLRTLGESNRTSFLTIEGGHMNIESWYVQQNLIPLLID